MSDLVDTTGLTRARGRAINPPINPPSGVDQPPPGVDRQEMTGAQYADHLGVSPNAVSKALKRGDLDGAVRWSVRGAQRVATIVDIPLADKLWMARPGAKAPALEAACDPGKDAPSGEPPYCCDSMWAACIEETVGPVMDVPRLAKERIPGLSAEAVEILTELCADALAGLIPDEENVPDVMPLIEDDANEAIVKELLRRRRKGRDGAAKLVKAR